MGRTVMPSMRSPSRLMSPTPGSCPVGGLVGGFEEAVVIDASGQSESGEVEAQGFA